jgi:hypothetical protein
MSLESENARSNPRQMENPIDKAIFYAISLVVNPKRGEVENEGASGVIG